MADSPKNPFEPFARLQTQWQEEQKAVARFQQLIQAQSVDAQRASNKIRAQIARAVEADKQTAELVAKILQSPSLNQLTDLHKKASALDAAGWLPHHTTPFHYIDECNEDTTLLRSHIEDHYRNEWASVSEAVQSRLADYDIDEEAKTTFREALDAHGAGNYRCVVRVLFPEFERIVRIAFHNDNIDEGIASLPKFQDLAGELALVDVEPRGYFALMLFEKLTRHLYKRVKETNRNEFADDPVPNRHAAVHGLVVYSSPQNSLNTIFMGDYVFQVITALKYYSANPPSKTTGAL